MFAYYMHTLTEISVSHHVAIYSGPDGRRGKVIAQSNDGCDLLEMLGNVCFCPSPSSKILCVCVRVRVCNFALNTSLLVTCVVCILNSIALLVLI